MNFRYTIYNRATGHIRILSREDYNLLVNL